jgi:hypothetical protein
MDLNEAKQIIATERQEDARRDEAAALVLAEERRIEADARAAKTRARFERDVAECELAIQCFTNALDALGPIKEALARVGAQSKTLMEGGFRVGVQGPTHAASIALTDDINRAIGATRKRLRQLRGQEPPAVRPAPAPPNPNEAEVTF